MQRKPLHIISFDNPYPPVYGGVIDVWYKIKALDEAGFDIYLHCFVDQIRDIHVPHVSKAWFYKRNKSLAKLFSRVPFAVSTRQDAKLIDNIGLVDAPVLFEGLQTTGVAHHLNIPRHKMFLRLHNLEAKYFLGQFRSERNLIKKVAYLTEFLKYGPYQRICSRFERVFTLSVAETDFIGSLSSNAMYVPVFHGNATVKELAGAGRYALYHGDLRLPDNRRAARFLISVFAEIPGFELVIASGADAGFLDADVKPFKNISLVTISGKAHLHELLEAAHVNVMISFQESGTKLKLVNALFNSRFCVANSNMVDDPELRALCLMAETKEEFVSSVRSLIPATFDGHKKRVEVLGRILSDRKNAMIIRSAVLSE